MYTYFNTINRRASGKRSFSIVAVMVSMVAAVLAALVSGPAPSATAVTSGSTAAVRVIPNASGQAPLLTATRLAGGENRFQLTTAALHVNPLPGTDAPQFVQVEWELQSAAPGPNMQWTKVDYRGPGFGLYSVAEDPDDSASYVYVPLTGGRDLGAQEFTSRVVTGKEQAFRVVATITWSVRSTGAVLGSVTLTSTNAADFACRGTTSAHCRVISNRPAMSAGSFVDLLP